MSNHLSWVVGELRLAGIDHRMMALLAAIAHTGSISQAAKQSGLSYKGAWQMIERANNSAPKLLVHTAKGGSKGGGACLTDAGQSLLTVFLNIQQQHQQFLAQLNQQLAVDPDRRLLLERLAVKTSLRNQLFGTISAIQRGAVNAEIKVRLVGGAEIKASVGLSTLDTLALQLGQDILLLINSIDIMLVRDASAAQFSASNCLSCQVLRVQHDEINAEVSVSLSSGELMSAVITRQSSQQLALAPGSELCLVFKANAPLLGVKQFA